MASRTTAGVRLLKELYLRMVRLRAIEEGIATRYPEKEMRCPIHLSIGQEGPAIGVCAALEAGDYVMSTHRSHGHYLGKGGDLKAMLAEFYGRAHGCSVGKGGSMHLIDMKAGFLGATPIVGSTIAIAAGAAFGVRLRGEKRVVAAFFGDAAVEEGVFHEAMNFASLKKLPIVFVCENNLYSVYSPLSVRQPKRPLAALARAHAVRALRGDGNDVLAAHRLAGKAVRHARSGAGPVFLELDTYRWREHCGPNFDNDIGYRTEAEFLKWKARDPLARCGRKLRAAKAFEAGELEAAKARFQAEIDEAFRFARACPRPAKSELMTEVYAGEAPAAAKAAAAEAAA